MNLNMKSHKKFVWKLCLGLFLTYFLAACSQEDNFRTVNTLRIAVIPDQDETQLRAKYQPLLDHISEHTGIKSELMIPDSYEQALQWFTDKKVDMAKFGGVTYVKARLKVNATPLVMRDVDGRFRSVVLANINNPAKNMKELKGSSFAFGSRLSTSGHFMPRHFFQKQNIEVESFFSKVMYSDAHDRTAEWIRDGKVDAGVANTGIVNEMFLDGRLSKDNIKVIWESPPYPDYVWAIQSDIKKEQQIEIRNVFLHLNQDIEGREMLENIGAHYFIPARHEDYSSLQEIILQLDGRAANK